MSAFLKNPALFPAAAWTLVRRLQAGESLPTAEQVLDALCKTCCEPSARG